VLTRREQLTFAEGWPILGPPWDDRLGVERAAFGFQTRMAGNSRTSDRGERPMASKDRWASRLGLVLAMAGNAVGLGNFLRFPAQAVKNGGGAFIIPYLIALLVLGLPLIWVEWAMGRYGGRYGHHSAPGIFDVLGRRPLWKYIGVFGLWVNLIIAAYYLYIESWTLAYAGYSAIGGFRHTKAADFFVRLIGDQHDKIYAVSWLGMGVFFLCMAINVFILSRGLARGIELVAKVGMPLLILFAAVLAVRGLTLTPGGPDNPVIESPWKGLNYLWEPKFDSLANASVWLAAAGQIFFTLSIGMGSIHCYASYVRDQDDIALTGATAAWTNEFCEVILGGSILVPIAVAYLGVEGMERTIQGASGLDLGFKVFPEMFRNWGALAPAAGCLWFGLLFFAAITSSLAMGQPIMAFLQTEFHLSRPASALAFGGMLLPLAVPVAVLNLDTFFSEFDYWAGTFALVVFAAAESILFAWVFGIDRGWQEILRGAEIRVPRLFYYILRYVTPALLLVILAAYIFQPAAGWDAYVRHAHPARWSSAPAWEWSPDGMIGQLLFKGLHAKEARLTAELASQDSALDATQRAALETQIRLVRQTRLVCLIDRLVLVGSFAFFAVLVSIAWRRRRAEGRLPA
jgi:NSS family neurotransmitter:Na+ symporter